MKKIKAALSDLTGSMKETRTWQWKFSYDNDKVHMGADLSTVGIHKSDRFSLPPLSSDMHKAVEHVHAWLQAQMQKWLETMEGQKLTPEMCLEHLNHIFYQQLKASSIAADVATLKDTYQAIIAAGGGYPSKKYR